MAAFVSEDDGFGTRVVYDMMVVDVDVFPQVCLSLVLCLLDCTRVVHDK